MKYPVYFCNHCKKTLTDVEDLLFVEENSTKCFCSEECIEKYYTPHVNWYEQIERELRSKLSLNQEQCQTLATDPSVMDKVLSKPDEIWSATNELGEEVFTFIRHFNLDKSFYSLIVCHLFERQPSFILLSSASHSENYVNHFRVGEKIPDIDDFLGLDPAKEGAQAFDVNREDLNAIELKKSSFLADLLNNRTAADIPFEDFQLYEKFFQPTLEDPDEIFTDEDEEGDQLFTYIKAFHQDLVSFYYFIICVEFERSQENDGETRRIVPLIAFPTLDGELYKIYRSGKLVSGNLKN